MYLKEPQGQVTNFPLITYVEADEYFCRYINGNISHGYFSSLWGYDSTGPIVFWMSYIHISLFATVYLAISLKKCYTHVTHTHMHNLYKVICCTKSHPIGQGAQGLLHI